MKRTAYIAINGILTNPGDAEGWTDRFVTWVNTRLPDGVVAEKFEYGTGPLTRRLKQRERADAICKKIGYYRRAGYRVVIVSHSNGGDLTARVLNDAGVEIDSAHLFAPATDDELIAQAIREGAITPSELYSDTTTRSGSLAPCNKPSKLCPCRGPTAGGTSP